MNRTIKLLAFFIGAHSLVFGQMEQYGYKRELKGISDQWHKIVLPDEVFGKIANGLDDIRIYGITSNKDTIEAPYLLKVKAEEKSSKEVSFKRINTSTNNNGHYVTFEIPTNEAVNQIELDFNQSNFDWRVALEGSQDQKEWFTILKNYRILSIKNAQTDFKFTKLSFPKAKYGFYRLHVKSGEEIGLNDVSIVQDEIVKGTFKSYAIRRIDTKDDKKTKQTEIAIELEQPVRASQVLIKVSDTFDYYRPMTIKYLIDNIKTEQGWRYNYKTLTSGMLNSMEENTFRFNSTTLQKLKISIHNQDNQPLNIDTVQVKGYVHELAARFTGPATYFLVYGNERAGGTRYDIGHFKDKIPDTLAPLDLGDESKIEKHVKTEIEPLFKNKIWLWVIMGIIIMLLGGFSLKMIKKK